MQIKATLKFHLIPIRMAKIKNSGDGRCCKDVEKEEHSSIVGGIVSLYNYSVNQSHISSKKLDIVLPEDPTIPLLGIYPEDVPTVS